jgi:hypothetical protein
VPLFSAAWPSLCLGVVTLRAAIDAARAAGFEFFGAVATRPRRVLSPPGVPRSSDLLSVGGHPFRCAEGRPFALPNKSLSGLLMGHPAWASARAMTVYVVVCHMARAAQSQAVQWVYCSIRSITSRFDVRSIKAPYASAVLTASTGSRYNRKQPRPVRLLFCWERRKLNDVLEGGHMRIISHDCDEGVIARYAAVIYYA